MKAGRIGRRQQIQLQLIEQTENNDLKVKFKGTEISFCLV